MSNKTKLRACARLAPLPAFMRPALLLLLPLSLWLCGDERARAQSGAATARAAATAARPEQFVMPLHGEGFIAFRVEAAPVEGAPRVSAQLEEIQASLTPRVLLGGDHVIHRLVVDAEGNYVFGYDLVVEPVAASKQFKVSLVPLSAEFEEQLLRARLPTATATGHAVQSIATLPRPADTQLVEDGDAFALDLLVNSRTGVKIVDVVKVSFDRARLRDAPPRSMPLRDFTLGNVELAVRDYKLTINGELVGGGRSSSSSGSSSGSKPARGCAGALVWFHVPERGRFIFSLIPHEGYDFQKIGRIENNRISFSLGGDAYEWTSSAPVVGTSGGNWNLWVLHDAGYISDFDSQEQIVEGALEGPPARGGDSAASPEWLRDSLGHIRRERRAEFEARDEKRKRAARRPRVLVGGADRIENLLPKR